MPFYALEYINAFSGLISACLIMAGVMLAYQSSRQYLTQQRRKATAELLAPYYDRIIAPKGAFKIVSADEFSEGSSSLSAEKLESIKQIISYLNALEYISLLVNSKTVDEAMASSLVRGSVVAAFETLIEYILKVRVATNNPRLYQELEALAHRWGDDRAL